jgi:DNA polymerase-3 subunit chi
MTEISFYHLTASTMEKALPKLLEKAVSSGFRSVVVTKDEAQSEQLNALLWSYDPNSFLPHGSRSDPHPEAQPIYITHEPEAPNSPDMLVITDGSALELDGSLKRVLDLFDGQDEQQVEKARKRWKDYKAAGHAVSYFQQTETGSWKKAA